MIVRLPIVLFVGQHFSGSLFHLITLLLFTRETTKWTRVRDWVDYNIKCNTKNMDIILTFV